MNNILKGTMYLTNDIKILYDVNLQYTKIISLDEDGVLSTDNTNIIGGTCLLPPIEAKIAEADGNEYLYDQIYSSHLLDEYQQQFIAALLSFLYKGGNLILFLPDIGYSNTMDKLVFHIYNLYGIHIGIIGAKDPRIANWYYDNRSIPIWLNMIYAANVISPYEYLFDYPLDAQFTNERMMSKMISELNPYGSTFNEKINYILRLHRLIHINPRVVPAIQSIR